jgi:thioredoxin 1
MVAGALILAGLFVISGKARAAEEKQPKPGRAGAQPAVLADSKRGVLATLVELGSVNCIPCKAMQPVMKAVEKEYGGRVKVVFYDVWTPEGRPYAEKYQIRAIPTQVFLDQDGKEFFRHMGFFSKEEIAKVLKQQGVQ